MAREAITFSVNDYDFEGDVFDTGIYLHFGEVRVKVADDIAEFEHFVAKRIMSMVDEIREAYPSA